MSSSWTSEPFTEVRRAEAVGWTRRRERAGPAGVKPSCPFARTVGASIGEAQVVQRRVVRGRVPSRGRALSIVTRRAALPITTAISPSKRAARSLRPHDRRPVAASDDGGLRKYEGNLGTRPRLPRPCSGSSGARRRSSKAGAVRPVFPWLPVRPPRARWGSASRQNAIRSPPFRFGRDLRKGCCGRPPA